GRHRPQDRRRGVHQQRARIAADSVPGTLRAEHAGGGLVRHEDDAEGHDAGPRSGPPARRGHADHGRCQRNADSGARPGSREEGLRRRVQRDRQAIRSPGMSTAATSKTASQADTSKTASQADTSKTASQADTSKTASQADTSKTASQADTSKTAS